MTGGIARTAAVSAISILAGLAIGAAVLGATGNNPVTAYEEVFRRGFGCRMEGASSCQVYFTLRSATPIILTALSAVVAFRAGVFSIGMEGQYLLGALASAVVGGYVHTRRPSTCRSASPPAWQPARSTH